jgi:hypothetical protein
MSNIWLHAQFKEYLDRAEFVKGILDGQIPAETSTSNGAVGQKARPPGGGDNKDVSTQTPLHASAVISTPQAMHSRASIAGHGEHSELDSMASTGVREGQAAQLARQRHHGGAAKREGARKLLLVFAAASLYSGSRSACAVLRSVEECKIACIA